MKSEMILLRCPICDEPVPCISKFITLYCLAMHIAAKWDDEDHLRWRREHGITCEVYQSMGHVQTVVRQIMAAIPQHDMTKVWSKSYRKNHKISARLTNYHQTH